MKHGFRFSGCGDIGQMYARTRAGFGGSCGCVRFRADMWGNGCIPPAPGGA
ncbi:hypothetical protein M1B78_17460 [Bacteroides sp. KH569_7]|uniref:Uncharacterized protein n=1 Tax=Bacteroides muris (ex Fokt et al. 2023) TaxID=2937417 RepID=A0A9X2P6C2_9BACE|nr:hypothetical protein [Bacteroides muris (ex Fokt et al. 2023)]MCR6509887.1 hypothetical protein [Bacteroides muris (ex Fokt et al. 2023)]